MTNHPKKFHSSIIFKTGLSDFHKLTLTVLKIQYGDFNDFDIASFRTDFFPGVI